MFAFTKTSDKSKMLHEVIFLIGLKLFLIQVTIARLESLVCFAILPVGG